MEREGAIKSNACVNDRIVNMAQIKHDSNACTWREWNKSYGIGDSSPECLHLVVVGELAGLKDLTGCAGGNFMFLVGLPKPDRP
jgi:hypothetical protein